ncbi:MAG: hypothetical protein J5689_00145 [Clostridia bacterium]|nr:hypothetical protein [Clostridia bacterium]
MQQKFNSLSDKFFIEKSVKIDKTAIIYPGVILSGTTIIEAGAVIMPGCVIVDSKVGKNTIVKNSYIEKSEIGEGCEVGPFSNLRPGSIISDKVKVGAFCETKNVCVGRLSKISHLCYVGDAVVGEKCNIGCGVVFANFNGKIKQKTHIGNHVFVGCNVNLVAPLRVSDDAYICAGTTVTEDVSKGAFVIGRTRAVSKDCKAKIYWE